MYEAWFELELVQLLVKIFNLELEDDDGLNSEIRAIMHGIDASEVNTFLYNIHQSPPPLSWILSI